MAVLQLTEISKSFGAIRALHDVNLTIEPGEVLGLMGDNGAGKSTLIRILSGAQSPTAGTMLLRGQPVRFRSPQDALAQGVATIYQDLALAPRLSIAANIFMGAELTRPLLRILDKRRMRVAALGYLARLSPGLSDMRRPVEGLSGGQRQAVAIARALRWNAEVIIMDEPTAALGVKETAQVLDLVRRLKAEGHTIILISHSMADVVALADRVAILRSGRKVVDRPVGTLRADDLAHLIMTQQAA